MPRYPANPRPAPDKLAAVAEPADIPVEADDEISLAGLAAFDLAASAGGRDGRLCITEDHREVVEAHLAEYRRDMAEKAARLKPPGHHGGRDGNALDLVEEQAADANERAKTYRNVARDPVELLFSRKSLTQRQHEAALRLRADVELAQTTVRAASLGGRVSGGGGGISDARLDAISRTTRCMKALSKVSAILVRAAVLDCTSLSDIGARHGWSKNYTGPRLAEALDEVADFYRL